MKENILQQPTFQRAARKTTLALTLIFCVSSLLLFSIRKESEKGFMSLVSILFVCIPNIAERLFRFRIQTPLYVCVLFYAVCPLLGFSYGFYYALPWWDDLLHAFAGVIFAMFGAFLPHKMVKEPSLALCAFCAFFFSVAIAGLWELVEFFLDSYFGTDMQKDTLLPSARPSYLLSELFGAPRGTLLPLLNAQTLVEGAPVDYYVDLGLIDSMKDVFIETLGAFLYTLAYLAGKGKRFGFEPLPVQEESEKALLALPELAATQSQEEKDAR